ncbi:hypothetical protein [Pseudofulvimonas gallinarii]|uniref:hypothetical protein n=1 Tax=Pseudofulvimonas gallinarii TaxID=634155 RepID=UPI0035E93D7D
MQPVRRILPRGVGGDPFAGSGAQPRLERVRRQLQQDEGGRGAQAFARPFKPQDQMLQAQLQLFLACTGSHCLVDGDGFVLQERFDAAVGQLPQHVLELPAEYRPLDQQQRRKRQQYVEHSQLQTKTFHHRSDIPESPHPTCSGGQHSPSGHGRNNRLPPRSAADLLPEVDAKPGRHF